jgi:TRAP-type C4-dicarboxylate transport system substrate-binding protein
MRRQRQTVSNGSLERRRFLKVASRYGFTTAVLAAADGYLWSGAAIAQMGADEEAKRKAAKHTIIMATEYQLGSERGVPLMQSDFKNNIEKLGKGALYVQLYPAGQLGFGAALAQKVQGGTVQICSVSLSNLSPYAPVVDVVNIPFWCAENQKYANLVTSKVWADEVTPKVNAKNYKPLFYFTAGARTIAVRRGFGKVVKVPSDMAGVKMRIPPSKLLSQFYRLAGANPTIVSWGETPTALKQGVADALDPSLGGLWVFGFMEIVEAVTEVRSVSDAQVFLCNLSWFRSLPKLVQMQIDEASQMTQDQTYSQIPIARANAIEDFVKAGVKIYTPNAGEMKQWVDACGDQHHEWNSFKVDMAGSLANFDKLKAAANTKGKVTVEG